jgi:hypothetical protein
LKTFLLLFGAGLFGCNRPSSGEVSNAFHEENPSYSILSVYLGEGDGGASYFHIKYRKPLDEKTHEEVWQYLKLRDGKWHREHKETLQ